MYWTNFCGLLSGDEITMSLVGAILSSPTCMAVTWNELQQILGKINGNSSLLGLLGGSSNQKLPKSWASVNLAQD
ncbi:unnamed protein product [Caretta caretta]